METPAKDDGFLKKGGVWVILQGILLVAVLIWHFMPFASPAHQIPYFGPILVILGFILIFVACFQLGGNLSPMPVPKSNSELQTSGIYAMVRHPIYAGLILIAIGIYALFPSFGQGYLTVATMAFFGAKATREERWMRQRFPEYVEYMDRSWRFIPFFS